MMELPDQEELDDSVSKAWTIPLGIFCLLVALINVLLALLGLSAVGISLFRLSTGESSISAIAQLSVCPLLSAILALFMGFAGLRMLWPGALGARALRILGRLYIGAGWLITLLSILGVPASLLAIYLVGVGHGIWVLGGVPFLYALGRMAISIGKEYASGQSADATDATATTETPQKFGRP